MIQFYTFEFMDGASDCKLSHRTLLSRLPVKHLFLRELGYGAYGGCGKANPIYSIIDQFV